MSRVVNFNPGPATLPLPVLERAREEFLDFAGTGMSVMEMSHRGKVFLDVAARTESALRRLMSIPDDYRVLFLQGGASLMFAGVPLNLLPEGGRAGYVNTGAWSTKAITQARAYADVEVVASSEATKFDRIPDRDTWGSLDGLRYLHVTPNETIGGVEFHSAPDTGGVPLVADMSSNILSRPIDVRDYDLIYAGAQKNIAISGIALVIVHESLVGTAHPMTPSVMNFAAQLKSDSMLNTPPTFAWYLAGLVFDWLEAGGGLEAMGRANAAKAKALYGAIDGSNFYTNPVAKPDRSSMNVPFTLADAGLDNEFLQRAEAAGLAGLKGHRAVGGMRASIYNATPLAGVESLVEFMQEFERTHG
jgi:phosphoserine aminotransferase